MTDYHLTATGLSHRRKATMRNVEIALEGVDRFLVLEVRWWSNPTGLRLLRIGHL